MGTRRIRFRLKSLFAAMTMLCILLALIAQPLMEERRQQEMLNQWVARGGKIDFITSIPRELSLGRTLLAMLNTSHDRYKLYGLDLSGAKISDDDLEQVIRIRHIKELKLAGTQVTDTGIKHLQKLEFLSKLDVGGTRVTDRGVADLDNLRNLCSLRVDGTSVTYDALEKLDATLPYAHFCEDRAIEELKAVGIQVLDTPRFLEGDMDQGMGTIRAGNEAFELVVGMNRKLNLTPADVLHLNYLQSVREITFHTITLGPGGLERLQPLASMKDLSIWNVNLSDRDLEAIARQPQLESLMIYGSPDITNDGLSHLRTLKKLQKLHIEDCNGTTREGMSVLERELPECQCRYIKYTP